MSSDSSNTTDSARAGYPRNGFLAWLVFILAAGAVLAVVGGCMAMVYGPVLTG